MATPNEVAGVYCAKTVCNHVPAAPLLVDICPIALLYEDYFAAKARPRQDGIFLAPAAGCRFVPAQLALRRRAESDKTHRVQIPRDASRKERADGPRVYESQTPAP